MKFLDFYYETNEILEKFYRKMNISIEKFRLKENHLNYLERTFFNCGSNLFIIDVLKDDFDNYHSFFNKYNLNDQERMKKLLFIKKFKINNKHKFSEYFDKYFYSEILSIDEGYILKEYLEKIGFYTDNIYKNIKYILSEKTPIIKGSIENFHPNYYFISPFNQKIHFNVVLSNIFIKLLKSINTEFLESELILKLLKSWYKFYIIKVFLLTKIPDIVFVNSEDFYIKYFNNSLNNLRIKKAIENDIKVINYKYQKIKKFEKELKNYFIDLQSIILTNDLSKLSKEFYILSNFLATPLPF